MLVSLYEGRKGSMRSLTGKPAQVASLLCIAQTHCVAACLANRQQSL